MFLDSADIDWIEAAGVYVHLHVGPKSYLYRATLGQLQERLDPTLFVRIHRSAMVNTDRILELQPRTHGDYVVILKNGTELTLSRGYRAQLEGWLRQPL
jgi:two-component system, LytTR family, response regulator